MKRIIFTYITDFPDDLPDDKCIQSAIEIMEQDEYSDDNFKIWKDCEVEDNGKK